MAVQQNKKSPSKRGMHRSHNALNVPGIAVEPTTGETHLRHHISPNGFYRGRQVAEEQVRSLIRLETRGPALRCSSLGPLFLMQHFQCPQVPRRLLAVDDHAGC